MIVIICVDDKNGMMFNHRRQSKDKELRKVILKKSKGKKIWMNNYSMKQFEEEDCGNITVDEKFLQKAESEDYCFVEDIDIEPYIDYIDELILIRWNRIYPADFYFKIDMGEWNLVNKEEFIGSSHERITWEDYVR
ncbi:ribonuclease Z [Hungatella sp.]|uniref:ribonuclease Z n=1 Tax=Hungatella sp. TaxID=2613924 RepID=UPI003993CD47